MNHPKPGCLYPHTHTPHHHVSPPCWLPWVQLYWWYWRAAGILSAELYNDDNSTPLLQYSTAFWRIFISLTSFGPHNCTVKQVGIFVSYFIDEKKKRLREVSGLSKVTQLAHGRVRTKRRSSASKDFTFKHCHPSALLSSSLSPPLLPPLLSFVYFLEE